MKNDKNNIESLSDVENDIIQSCELNNIEQDIIKSSELNKLAILDDIEDKISMVEGSLTFAMQNTEHQGFYSGLNEHLKSITGLLNKLRK